MAINKAFESDDSSSEGSGARLAPEPSAPPLELGEDQAGNALFPPVVATPIPPADNEPTSGNSTDQATISSDEVPSDWDREQTRSTAAGIAAGIVGLFLGGPILALIAGGGTIYAARQRDSSAGDFARAVGDLALTARDKAKELDEKHHVVDKTKAAAGDAWEKARELEKEHHFLERIQSALAVREDGGIQ